MENNEKDRQKLTEKKRIYRNDKSRKKKNRHNQTINRTNTILTHLKEQHPPEILKIGRIARIGQDSQAMEEQSGHCAKGRMLPTAS